MAKVDRVPVHTGGCQCGSVRYALYADPERVHYCHCRMCQKAVGGPFAGLAPVRVTDFAWTRGSVASFRSSSVAERGFCPRCGTPLSFRYLDSDWIDVTLGSLDRPAAVTPERQYGLEARIPWVASVLDRPGETTAQSMDTDRQAALLNFQHPDHDTPDGWAPTHRSKLGA